MILEHNLEEKQHKSREQSIRLLFLMCDLSIFFGVPGINPEQLPKAFVSKSIQNVFGHGSFSHKPTTPVS